jgi:retinal rod rhodopsin-sensitive cGMP 3',5'-cyclic phosphodiesterase subunit delta
MLKSKQLARMIVFSSKEPVEKMSLIQKMYLHGQLVETLLFEFGFVIPNSTNSWEQTIVADEGNVMPAEILSGNLTCETLFYSHGVPIHKSSYLGEVDPPKFTQSQMHMAQKERDSDQDMQYSQASKSGRKKSTMINVILK